jgi:hypothetical protein
MTRKKDTYTGETVERSERRGERPLHGSPSGPPSVCGLFELVQLVGGVIHIHKILDRGVIEDAE